MPIYEYRCESCGREFERLTRSGAQKGGVRSAAPSCPDCGSATRRMFSRFGTRAAEPRAAGGAGNGCGCTPSGCGCRVH